MTEEVGVVRRVVWREILPWLIIFRAFRISISLPVLALASIGWLLTPVGSQIASALFLGDTQPVTTDWGITFGDDSLLATFGISTSNPIILVYYHFTDPFVQLFDRSNTIRETAYHLFCGLWSIGVWAFFAGAITRIATVQLGREERVDLRKAVLYSGRLYGWSFVAPLFPLFGVFLASLPLMFLGLLMRADVGMIVAGIVWPLAIMGGLVMTVLLLGLAVGWPLMWPTISSEEQGDAFESFSRSFSYVFQRPLQYAFYLLLVLLLGGLGLTLISTVSEAVIELTYFGTSWGASNDRVDLIPIGEYTGPLGLGVGIIRFFTSSVRVVAMAFNFSFFFCSATAIYLVLRRDADKIDFDEVYTEDDERQYSLPPLDSREEAKPTVIASSDDDMNNAPAS